MPESDHPFDQLHTTIKQLRGPDGCPWDKKQTVLSLTKYLHEEFNEIIEAIDKNNPHNLCEELGDFLYLILMICEISEAQGHFTSSDVLTGIDQKLIRRHPHVFETRENLDASDLREQWERIKKAEKTRKIS